MTVLNAIWYLDIYKHVENVKKNDRQQWSQLTPAWNWRSASPEDHLEFSTSARRGWIPAGWLLSEHSHQWCSWLRQVAPPSRTQRVKIAMPPVSVALLHLLTFEPHLYRKAGTEWAPYPVWTCCRSPGRHLGTTSVLEGLPCAPRDYTIENSCPVINTEWGCSPEWLDSGFTVHALSGQLPQIDDSYNWDSQGHSPSLKILLKLRDFQPAILMKMGSYWKCC